MKKEIKQFALRIDPYSLDKLGYIAGEEDRSINREIVQLIRRHISEYEKAHGEITLEDMQKYKADR